MRKFDPAKGIEITENEAYDWFFANRFVEVKPYYPDACIVAKLLRAIYGQPFFVMNRGVCHLGINGVCFVPSPPLALVIANFDKDCTFKVEFESPETPVTIGYYFKHLTPSIFLRDLFGEAEKRAAASASFYSPRIGGRLEAE